MDAQVRDYFRNRDRERLYTTMVLLFFTAGLYIFIWMYMLNKDIEKFDDEAPESRRGLIVLFFLPISWNSIYLALKLLIIDESKYFLELLYIEAIGWTLVTILAIKYIHDFCVSFGKLTRTHTLIWYLLYYFGIVGLVLFILNIQWGIFLLFLPFICIFLMQMEINRTIEYAHRNKIAASFNTQKRYL